MTNFINIIDDVDISIIKGYESIDIELMDEKLLSFENNGTYWYLLNIMGEDESGMLDLDGNEQLKIIGVDEI